MEDGGLVTEVSQAVEDPEKEMTPQTQLSLEQESLPQTEHSASEEAQLPLSESSTDTGASEGTLASPDGDQQSIPPLLIVAENTASTTQFSEYPASIASDEAEDSTLLSHLNSSTDMVSAAVLTEVTGTPLREEEDDADGGEIGTTQRSQPSETDRSVDALAQQLDEERNRAAALQEANTRLQGTVCTILQVKMEGIGLTKTGSGTVAPPWPTLNDSDEGNLDTKGGQAELEKRYQDSLEMIHEAQKEYCRVKEEYEKQTLDLQTRLETSTERAAKIHQSFQDFKRDIAKGAQNSRTGAAISDKMIKQFEATETEKDKEIEKLRLRNIHVQFQAKKLDAQLAAKEQLAEGLHLIDFEQLKIENQGLTEKIEERNEDLNKLRKKTTSTVQVLTHVKEKLQFLRVENKALKEELEQLDTELLKEKDKVTKSKKERERIKTENKAARVQQGFSKNDLLVADYEKRKAELVALEKKVAELKQRYSDLTMKVKQHQQNSTKASVNQKE